jgi:hypothetical protein
MPCLCLDTAGVPRLCVEAPSRQLVESRDLLPVLGAIKATNIEQV